MKKLDLKKETFEIVTIEELELVGAAAKTHQNCETARPGCPAETDIDVTCTESVCYCKS